MLLQLDDTICAVATAPGGSCRGMIRISGDDAVNVAGRLFESKNGRRIDERRTGTAMAGSVRIELGDLPTSLPCDLFLWPTSRSYTREPIAELHTIGQTLQGREMWVMKISDNVNVEEAEPEFKYVSTMHGDEVVGKELMMRLIKLLLTQYGNNSRIDNLVKVQGAIAVLLRGSLMTAFGYLITYWVSNS